MAQKGDNLEDFMTRMMKGRVTKDAGFALAADHLQGISYTVQDKSIYEDRGGAHIHFIGIERDYPADPGLALESPGLIVDPKESEQPGLNYFTLETIRNRFPGKIFYFFVLDTCEDIHTPSWAVFRDKIIDRMILE